MKLFKMNRNTNTMVVEMMRKNALVRQINELRNDREDLINDIETLIEKIFSAKRNEDNELEVVLTKSEIKVLTLI